MAVQRFFTSSPHTCPYMGDGRLALTLLTKLAGPGAQELHDKLSAAGFRRSHNIAYAPLCPACTQCVPIRVCVEGFQAGRSQRRVIRKNQDIHGRLVPNHATAEHYLLFRQYIESRHQDSEMKEMNFQDFCNMIEESPLRTSLVEFRNAGGTLVAVSLLDRFSDGLSAVYNFFDPEYARRSMGVFMILWLRQYAHRAGLPYLYLGYWVKGSHKMSYKTLFHPYELLVDGQWVKESCPSPLLGWQ